MYTRIGNDRQHGDAGTDIFVALLQAALHDHLIPRYRRREISHLVRRGEVGDDHIGAAVGVMDLSSDGGDPPA
jgi:hypothetical protein